MPSTLRSASLKVLATSMQQQIVICLRGSQWQCVKTVGSSWICGAASFLEFSAFNFFSNAEPHDCKHRSFVSIEHLGAYERRCRSQLAIRRIRWLNRNLSFKI